MGEGARWVLLARYHAPYEADLAVGALRAAGIPALIKGTDVGMFGPGFAGPTAHAIEVHVPAARLEEARAVLGLDKD